MHGVVDRGHGGAGASRDAIVAGACLSVGGMYVCEESEVDVSFCSEDYVTARLKSRRHDVSVKWWG